MKIDLTINQNNLDNDFKRISYDLMNYWVLKVETKKYRIAEIEFYLKSESNNDEYTHSHKLQLEKERWYFHGSGLDITFGDKVFYGSILIRALFDFESKTYIYGPLNCVAEIFSNIYTIHETNLSFGLVRANSTEFEMEEPIAAPRVGINPKKDKAFYEAFYRFLIMPKEKHIDKTRIAEGMKLQKYSDEEIKKIWR